MKTIKKAILAIIISVMVLSCSKEEIQDCDNYEMVNQSIEVFVDFESKGIEYPENPNVKPACDYPEVQVMTQGIRDNNEVNRFVVYTWVRTLK
tara:strand:+ start:24694 stop:24972 length:279 start_codon:yes stop_codon:yes gene_type:complete